MKKNEKEIIIRDAITAGTAKAFRNVTDGTPLVDVTPIYDKSEVTYRLRGDVDAVLRNIAENFPVGSRDVLEGIKSCRAAIFLFRQGVAK
ncbi:MAG: hypothetical protein M1497_15965 [Nitrospirae bacterium]|nr:hypothetical protein [Nitrospirota bacterium]